MSNISVILEGLNQNRLNEGKKKTIRDLILLRAAYNKNLHDAIEKGNQKALDKWVNDYKSDPLNKEELSWYEDEKLDVKKLKKELAKQDSEYNNAHKSGREIFGE